MNKTVTVILAVVLMVIVMFISAVFYFTGIAGQAKWDMPTLWSVNVSGEVQSLKAINLTGDKTPEIFLQTDKAVSVFDLQGKSIWQASFDYLATTMGDFNGDGVDDIMVIYGSPGRVQAELFTGDGRKLWSQPLLDLGTSFGLLSRALSVDFDGDKVREAVAGDTAGRLVCLESNGAIRWTYALPQPSRSDEAYVRGLDDVALGAGRMAVVAANYAGHLALLDGSGKKLWDYTFTEQIRRVRVYDLDGTGVSKIIVGGLNGTVSVLDAAEGNSLWTGSVGSRVQEIRDAQLDDNPQTREFIVGTKDGLVLAFNNKGGQLFSASASNKVTDIATADLNGDGRDEVIVGDDGGSLTVFKPTGEKLAEASASGSISALDVGKLGKGHELLVAASELSLRRVEEVHAPWWYNPLLAGFLACLVIAALAWGVTMLKPPPKMEYSAEDMTLEGLRAKRKMLLESRAEVRRLHDSGEIPTEAFTARNQQLREQLAVTEAKMLELGEKLQPEVMKCPNCGAALELGTDRCEYCGQVIV
jgi:outer membrane protein assembly factor BamB